MGTGHPAGVRGPLLTLLGVLAVEWLLAPFGSRVFDHLFPPELGLRGMMPDIPGYQWGYASVLMLGVLIGVAYARWRNRRGASRLVPETTDAGRSFSFERTPTFIHHRTSEDGKAWITVRVRFHPGRIASNARPQLLSVQLLADGRWSDDRLAAAKPLLSWIGKSNRFEPRSVPEDEYILLLDYDVAERRLSFVNDKKHAPYSITAFLDDVPHGKYLVTIGVTSDNLGLSKSRFVLDWFGDFELMNLEPFPDRTA